MPGEKPNSNPIQTNFTAGEVSKPVAGRPDLDKYKNALEKCENFHILEQGTLFRRSGSRYIDEVKTSADAARLVPFEYSTESAYVLEFGDQYYRVYADEARLAVEETTNVPWLESEVADLDWAQSASELYVCHGNYPTRRITRSSDTVWTTEVIESTDGPYFYENTDTSITVTASALSGVVTITASAPIFAATDTSGTGGTGLTDRHFRVRDAEEVPPVTDPITTPFTLVGWGKITGFTSTTVVEVTTEVDFDSLVLEPSSFWRLGAWSSTTGYPRRVVFFEERLVFANTATQPDTLWASKAQDYQLFAPSEYDSVVNDDNGFAYVLPSSKVNAIQWLEGGNTIGVGTLGAEYILATTDGAPMTPRNVTPRRRSTFGSEDLRPVNIDASTMFLQRSGRKLREFVYGFDQDTNTSTMIGEDLTILSSHILREGGKAVDMVYQQQPNSVVHTVRQDGQLASLTINRRQNVFGWGRHKLGGSFGSTEHGVVESVAVVPSADNTTDTLYLLVKRTINGATVRYVEFFEEDFYPTSSQDKADMFFVDCGHTLSNPFITAGNLTSGVTYRVTDITGGDYSGVGGPASPSIGEEFTATSTATPTYGSGSVRKVQTVITGLTHLEGETVHVVGDGAEMPDEVVASGQITLSANVAFVNVGLRFVAEFIPLPMDAGASNGSAQGKIKRTDHVTFRLMDSLGMELGPVGKPLIQQSLRGTTDPMDSSPGFFSGDLRVHMDLPHDTTGQFVVRQTQGYPLNVVDIMPEIRTTQK